ncbi:MAG: hypothetical protein H7Z71_08855, partial [Moraxellaceae bacterium]|nr:hypothetical protein [Pseudobdellovibrionaceae bacterium]
MKNQFKSKPSQKSSLKSSPKSSPRPHQASGKAPAFPKHWRQVAGNHAIMELIS